jgi:transcriptional regulator with XRE-family HTH domain
MRPKKETPAKAPPTAIERQDLSAGPGRKRTKTQREADKAEVERLDRRGYSQRQIAERLGVAPSQVCYDLKLLRKRYQDTQLAERSAAVAEKLEQYREVRREAWEAWDRSKDNKEKEIKEKISNLAQQAEAGAVEKLKAVITTEGRLPGNEYLRTILETLQDERELLGLDAPKKQELSGPDGSAVPVRILEVVLAHPTLGTDAGR